MGMIGSVNLLGNAGVGIPATNEHECNDPAEANQGSAICHISYRTAFHRLLCGRLFGSGFVAIGFIDLA
jgi:hypothetical protein